MEAYEVVVPIIQRDFAQGRQDPRTAQIREQFIAALNDATADADAPPLDLGLIYGFAEEASSAAPPTLTLLDGQQRMTTLFLLHWYVAQRAGVAEDARERLSRFTYETRASARDFCRSLSAAVYDELDRNAAVAKVKDSSWFFRSWMKDPTIRGMLVMLNAIEQLMRECDHNAIWNRLTSATDPPVHFQFLSMKEVGLTDDVYIKMNSRGRQLTDYERFKAWLEHYCEEHDLQPSPVDWQERLDMSWTDLMWKNRRHGATEIDGAYFKILKSLALNFVVSVANAKEVADLVRKVHLHVFLSNTDLARLFGKASMEYSFTVLDRLSEGGLNQVIEAISSVNFFLQYKPLDPFFDDRMTTQSDGAITYPDRVRFYALCRFLTASGGGDWDVSLKRWIRFIRNLTENSNLEYDEYLRAVRSLAELQDGHVLDILGYLSTEQPKGIAGFSRTQVLEEVRKARLVMIEPAWEALLENAENHHFFRGQIRIALDLAVPIGSDEEIPSDFEKYSILTSNVFANELAVDKESLLQRAMLSQADYAVYDGGYRRFGRSSEDWRNYMLSTPERIVVFRSILDRLKPGGELAGLREIIDSADLNDWRERFVRNPRILEKCGSRMIYFGDNGNEIRLLSKTRTSSKNAELRTYDAYLTQLSCTPPDELAPFKASYLDSRSWDDCPEAVVYADWVKICLQYPGSGQVPAYQVQVLVKGGRGFPVLILPRFEKMEVAVWEKKAGWEAAYVCSVPSENETIRLIKELVCGFRIMIEAGGEDESELKLEIANE